MGFTLGVLTVIGVLFVLQIKLSTREKSRGIFILPSVLLAMYLILSLAIPFVGNQYYVKEYSSTDQLGNRLEMIVQVPKDSERYAGAFSNLRIFDSNRVPLDEITLFYDKNVPADDGPQKTYEPYIRDMLKNVKLDGPSRSAQDVADAIPFLNMTFTVYPLLAFAVPFGIPSILLIVTGFVARALQARRLRIRGMNKIDIQSFRANI